MQHSFFKERKGTREHCVLLKRTQKNICPTLIFVHARCGSPRRWTFSPGFFLRNVFIYQFRFLGKVEKIEPESWNKLGQHFRSQLPPLPLSKISKDLKSHSSNLFTLFNLKKESIRRFVPKFFRSSNPPGTVIELLQHFRLCQDGIDFVKIFVLEVDLFAPQCH